MRTGLVYAGDNPAVSVPGKGSLYFVTVMIRVFHTDNRFHMAKTSQQGDYLCLFIRELSLIGHILKLAASAFPVDLTWR